MSPTAAVGLPGLSLFSWQQGCESGTGATALLNRLVSNVDWPLVRSTLANCFPSPWPKFRRSNPNYWREKKSPACLRPARTPYTACRCNHVRPPGCASPKPVPCAWATSTATSDRMCIRVACGKGGHARYSVLSATLRGYLRTGVRTFRPRNWLFCNGSGAQPVSIESTQRAYQGSRHRARITKSGGPHTLRHCPQCGARAKDAWLQGRLQADKPTRCTTGVPAPHALPGHSGFPTAAAALARTGRARTPARHCGPVAATPQ